MLTIVGIDSWLTIPLRKLYVSATLRRRVRFLLSATVSEDFD
jgi:hypothetical protein